MYTHEIYSKIDENFEAQKTQPDCLLASAFNDILN